MEQEDYSSTMEGEGLKLPEWEYIFDRTDVRAIFLVLYSIVFCSCLVGNLLVIFSVALNPRLSSFTNLCLTNLAFADLSVGIFCIYQNILTHLMSSWMFGELLCKIYHFILPLRSTASILILVVISIQRYLALVYPTKCKRTLTATPLGLIILLVWIISVAFSSPRLLHFQTLSMPLPDGDIEIICFPHRSQYNSRLMDTISMTVFFLIPLVIIVVLHIHMGIYLWRRRSNRKVAPAERNPNSVSVEETDDDDDDDTNLKMLMVVVLAFALCHLPFYLRKIWQYWSPTWGRYQAETDFWTLLTTISSLIVFANCGMNPILYAVMSNRFRRSFGDLLRCRMRSGREEPSIGSNYAVMLLT